METEQIIKFLDQLIESSYQARIFAKEGVQNVLQINEIIKSKLIQNDALVTENLELKVKIEALENANKNYKERFADLDNAIEESKFITDAGEIDLAEDSVQELSPVGQSQNGTLKHSHKKH